MTLQNVNKKHIVLLTDCLADLAGGAEKQILQLAQNLDKNIYDVHVISLDCWGEASKDLVEATGSKLHIFKVVRIYGWSGVREGLRFFRFLKDNNIDALITYHFSSDMWGTFWGHLAGVRLIVSNRRDMGFWRKWYHVIAYKLINGWVNKIVTNAQSIRDLIIREEGLKKEKIEVISNGIDLANQNYAFTRADFGLKDSDIVLINVANLKPIKGHQYLVEAFAGVCTQYPQAKLVLVGRDELNGNLQSMARQLGIENNVLFLGKREDVNGLLNLADICVLTSLSEGLSNAIMEYMAAGKPVVATRVGGNGELVKDGVSGILVEKADVYQLKNALLELVADKQKRVNMGKMGKEIAARDFSVSSMVSKYERLISGMRVLHLISSGGLFGAERVVLNLASKSDGTIFVGAINNMHNPHLEIIEEAKDLGLNSVMFKSEGKFDIGLIKAVKRFIIENKIDIIHTHNYKSDIIGFMATRFTNVKWLATNHLWHSSDKKLRFYESLDAFVLKYAHKVVGVSNEIKQDLLSKNLKNDQVVVIDNGITIEKFIQNKPDGLRSSWGISDDDYAVVIVGRLAKEKGHEIFLRAAAEIHQTYKNVKFVIIGDGPLRDELQRQTRSLNISSHVVFTGIFQDMPAAYAVCDLMVNASYAEGLPMTILEAMASQLPVIATNVGAVGEVIKNDENGILIEPGDAHTLGIKIKELINDKEKRLRLAQKAYKDVCERYSDRKMADRYKEIYEELLH